MSTHENNTTTQTSLDYDHPIADRVNSGSSWSGVPLPPGEVAERYVGDNETIGGDRPHVLQHQIPKCIGETILTELPLKLMYRYQRGEDCMTAWRVRGTTQALLRYHMPREEDPVYMLPYFGESAHDILWMLAHSKERGIRFEIEHLCNGVVEGILRMTRPEYRAGVEALLNEHRVE